VLTKAREYVGRTRFKRVRETGVIGDTLAGQIARWLVRLQGDKALSQVEINQFQVLLREYREYREQERADFGDNVKRVEGSFAVPAEPSPERASGARSAMSFKRFVEEHAHLIPPGTVERTRTPLEALVAITMELLRSTDLLDVMHEEDLAATRENANP
jgi:hypothetical protein